MWRGGMSSWGSVVLEDSTNVCLLLEELLELVVRSTENVRRCCLDDILRGGRHVNLLDFLLCICKSNYLIFTSTAPTQLDIASCLI